MGFFTIQWNATYSGLWRPNGRAWSNTNWMASDILWHFFLSIVKYGLKNAKRNNSTNPIKAKDDLNNRCDFILLYCLTSANIFN